MPTPPPAPSGAGSARIRATRGALTVFLAALAVRAVYLFQIHGTPLTDLLLIDSDTYHRFAGLILSGRFHGEEVYSMNLLYPYFLAAVMKLTGGGNGPVLAAQAVLGSLTAALVFLLAGRVFGRIAAWTAGLAAAVYAPSVFYTGALLTPVLINLLSTAALLLLILYRDLRRARLLVPAGLALGLASLGRGNSLLLVPLSLWFFATVSGSRRRAVARWALFTAAALLLPAAMTVRNALVEGRFVPLSANYAAFYIGHNDRATGLYALPDFAATAAYEGEVTGAVKAVSAELGRPVTLAEASAVLFRKGVSWAVDHPGRELRLTARKFYYFWNRTESPTNLNFYFARDYSGLLRFLVLGFGTVAPLGLVGMYLSRRRWREHLILYLYGSVYLLTALLFYVSAEYRLPVLPVLLVFAASIPAALARDFRARRRPGVRLGGGRGPRPAGITGGEAAVAGLLLAGLLVFCNTRDRLMTLQSVKRVDYYNFGVLYKERGDDRAAEAMLRRSLDIDPRFPPAYEALAAIEATRGNDAEARRLAELGRSFARGGRESRPPAPMSGADRDRIAAERLYFDRRYAEALTAFESLRIRYQAEGNRAQAVSMTNNIGLCRYKLGDLGTAESVFRELIAEEPGYVRAYTNLGLVLEASGRPGDAASAYRQALAVEPGNRKARRALDRLAAGGGMADKPGSP